MIPLPEDLPEPVGYRRVIDIYLSKGSPKRLQDWIEQWSAEDVDVLVSADYSHLLAVERVGTPSLALVPGQPQEGGGKSVAQPNI